MLIQHFSLIRENDRTLNQLGGLVGSSELGFLPGDPGKCLRIFTRLLNHGLAPLFPPFGKGSLSRDHSASVHEHLGVILFSHLSGKNKLVHR